jgi:hypothetical protein
MSGRGRTASIPLVRKQVRSSMSCMNSDQASRRPSAGAAVSSERCDSPLASEALPPSFTAPLSLHLERER